MKVTIYPSFILITARDQNGELIKLKYVGYTKAEAVKQFRKHLNIINNFK